MPPKKAAAKKAATTKKAAEPKPNVAAKRATTAREATAESESSEEASPAPAPKKAAIKKTPAATTKAKKAAVAQPLLNPPSKRKASEDSDDQPEPKKNKSDSTAPAPKNVAAAKTARAKPPVEKPVKVATKAAAPKPKAEPKPKPAPKAKAAPNPKAEAKPKPAPKPKAATASRTSRGSLPTINTRPTEILDVYVFGENGNGELGLGAKNVRGKMVIDVARPRLNPFLAATPVGIVALAVGGMHCAALTHDNQILTWGVNDQGALGRPSEADPEDVKMKDADASESESDSDDDFDEDSGLNAAEAEPRPVDPIHFPPGTEFAGLYAGDSNTFALTTRGQVYGWGTFRGNDGILGFTNDIKVAAEPMLIPDLKNIVDIVTGTNHVIALNNKGKCFIWGAGEQNQLGRRVVSRTASGALVPREFGLQRKTIVHIGAGDYHSFAVTKTGDVYAWGLNSFGQCGIPKEDEEDDTVATPTVIKPLEGESIKQISGGAHHSIALTENGKVLVWGRSDNKQCGIDISTLPKSAVFYDEEDRPRYLPKPVQVPNITGAAIATASDTAIVVDVDGKAFSWGFNGNLQTGQGQADDIPTATLIDNTAVRGKKLTWAGVGGQFGVLAGPHAPAP